LENHLADPLSVIDLSKKYNDYYALSPVTFSLNPAEITVLSGPNGSGKTTLLSCLAGLLRPTSGSVSVAGFDLYDNEVEVRKRLAFVPDVPRFYTELTAWEHLKFIAFANNNHENFEMRGKILLEKLGLWEARDLYPHNFSRGMRLKLGLALAFIRPFDLLLLDEPTSALDGAGIDLIISLLRDLRQKGKTVLLSTHDQHLIDALADRKICIDHGLVEGM
jgi:ABC-2 type transport system ATP-binding protein